MITIYTFTSAINPKTNKEVFIYETSLQIQEWEKSYYSNYTTIKPNLEKLKDSYIIFDKALEMWIYQPFNQEETTNTNENSNDDSVAKEEVIEEVAKAKSSKTKTRKKG